MVSADRSRSTGRLRQGHAHSCLKRHQARRILSSIGGLTARGHIPTRAVRLRPRWLSGSSISAAFTAPYGLVPHEQLEVNEHRGQRLGDAIVELASEHASKVVRAGCVAAIRQLANTQRRRHPGPLLPSQKRCSSQIRDIAGVRNPRARIHPDKGFLAFISRTRTYKPREIPSSSKPRPGARLARPRPTPCR